MHLQAHPQTIIVDQIVDHFLPLDMNDEAQLTFVLGTYQLLERSIGAQERNRTLIYPCLFYSLLHKLYNIISYLRI